MFFRKKEASKKTVAVSIPQKQGDISDIDEESLKILLKKDNVKGGAEEIKYTIYNSNFYGRIANSFFENLAVYLIKSFRKPFKTLKADVISSDLKILTKTYVSIILLSTFLAFFGTLLVVLLLSLFFGREIIISLVRSMGLAFLLGVVTFFSMYFIPGMIKRTRRKKIKSDLPFVIIHMAAVAGSGAQPISIFNLVLSTGEYPGIEREIRKIVNYVNLFGYDLTTALRNVAKTTPSPEFRELLVGIVSTLETGGNLEQYLKSKADDALTTYKFDRKKYVDTLSIYSDIYTGVLIAAPLLFIVTLTIINVLGGKVGPFEVKTLALFGTYLVIPMLNIGFIIFLNVIQPEI